MTSVDQPALEDDVTARLFELSVQRVRGTTAWQLMAPALVVMVGWLWLETPVVGVACLAAGLVGTWQYFAQGVPGAWGWTTAARRLLSEQPWRELPATVLDRLWRAMRLRDAGPWHRAEAGVPGWTTRANGVADGTIALRFPDGHRYTVHLERAPLDLFATAWREEALWLAPGGVVGFPDYPIAAVARVEPEN